MTNVPTSVRGSRPDLDVPTDFDGFWSQALAEVDAVDPAASLTRQHGDDAGLSLFSARFRSVGGCEIGGLIACWSDPKPRPLIVTSHGYCGRVEASTVCGYARAGANVVGLDTRGSGRSQQALQVSEHGYLVTGYEHPKQSILRGAVCDYLVAHRVAVEFVNASRTTFHGFSFAGGIASMAQAVSGRAQYLAVGVPTFGWTRRRLELCRDGSGRELRRFVDGYPDRGELALHTMRYFDIVHHAPRIRGAVTIGVGLRDHIVPPETVFAMVNHLATTAEVLEYPTSHSSEPEEQRWQEFERHWLARASSD